MSNMKNLLGDMDFEMVERILDSEDIDFNELSELYEKYGGDVGYYHWANIHGLRLINEWVESRYWGEDDIIGQYAEAVIYASKEYVKWLKSHN